MNCKQPLLRVCLDLVVGTFKLPYIFSSDYLPEVHGEKLLCATLLAIP